MAPDALIPMATVPGLDAGTVAPPPPTRFLPPLIATRLGPGRPATPRP
jgi:hypothetical protein